MKTFIIGLFSLTLLASGAAWGQSRSPQEPPQGPLPQIGVPAVCNYTAGIIVIVLTKTGDIKAFACSEVEGKSITKRDSALPGMTVVVEGALGTIKKKKLKSETDPCVTWTTASGTSYTYCW